MKKKIRTLVLTGFIGIFAVVVAACTTGGGDSTTSPVSQEAADLQVAIATGAAATATATSVDDAPLIEVPIAVNDVVQVPEVIGDAAGAPSVSIEDITPAQIVAAQAMTKNS